jgi:transforming growth factor-beta-induced protein
MSGQQGTSQDQMVDPGIDDRLATHTVADTLQGIKECSVFFDLIEAAGLLNMLRHSGLRTLLAPRNNALAGHTPSDPESFLENHLLTGGMKAADLRLCNSIRTVGGKTFLVESRGQNVHIGNTALTRTDIECTNGVIHVISAILTP